MGMPMGKTMHRSDAAARDKVEKMQFRAFHQSKSLGVKNHKPPKNSLAATLHR